jgi:hypothetical protein
MSEHKHVCPVCLATFDDGLWTPARPAPDAAWDVRPPEWYTRDDGARLYGVLSLGTRPAPDAALDVERVREALGFTDWTSDLDRAAATFLAAYAALEMTP